MRISNLFLQLLGFAEASNQFQTHPFQSSYLKHLRFTSTKLVNSSKAYFFIGRHLRFLFNNINFDDSEKMEIFGSFCDEFIKTDNDLTIGSTFYSLFNFLIRQSNFLQYENLQASLSFMSKISSTVVSDMILPVDYVYSLFLENKENSEFSALEDLMTKFINLIITLREKHQNNTKEGNLDELYHDLRNLSKEFCSMKIQSDNIAWPEVFYNNACDMFSSYFKLIALLIENPTPSKKSKEFSVKISDQIDRITLNFISILGERKNENFTNDLHDIFCCNNTRAFFELGFRDSLPASELIYLRRSNICERLDQITMNALGKNDSSEVPDIELQDLQTLLNFIIETFGYKSTSEKKRRCTKFFSDLFYENQLISFDDDDSKVNKVSRFTRKESKYFKKLKELVDDGLTNQYGPGS